MCAVPHAQQRCVRRGCSVTRKRRLRELHCGCEHALRGKGAGVVHTEKTIERTILPSPAPKI